MIQILKFRIRGNLRARKDEKGENRFSSIRQFFLLWLVFLAFALDLPGELLECFGHNRYS